VGENLRTVPIGEIVVSNDSADILVAYGLGSCVAICLYDPVAHVGGMLHALLPTAPDGSGRKGNPAPPPSAKFVDQGTPLLIESLLKLGAMRTRLSAQLCGGAQVLSAPGFENSLNIGERNIMAAEHALEVAGIPIRAQATGGRIGRTTRLHIADGQVTVKSLGRSEQLVPPGQRNRTAKQQRKQRTTKPGARAKEIYHG
jgi:chemotaxis protein CheD